MLKGFAVTIILLSFKIFCVLRRIIFLKNLTFIFFYDNFYLLNNNKKYLGSLRQTVSFGMLDGGMKYGKKKS